MDCSTPGFPVLHFLRRESIFAIDSLLRFMPIKLVMLSNHLILCCSLLFLPSIFPIIGFFFFFSPMNQLFASGGQSTGASASASILPMNIQGWFPLGFWFDLLAVQGTLKSLLQHHSSKASILQCSAFFIVQLSHSIHDYWKNHNFD